MSDDDLIRYDVLATEALRGVVKKVLGEVAKTGLPGEHHFFITFDTRHPGVRISSALKARYPQEMTIVMQHQFWDLEVHDHAFEIGLSFSGAPERLLVPFSAITGFTDPSVEFSLRFETVSEDTEIMDNDDSHDLAGNNNQAGTASHLKSVPTVSSSSAGSDKKAKSKSKKSPPSDGDDKSEAQDASAKDASDAAKKSAEVVSLDAFRKKP
jgi:hypothetical protein